MPGVEALVTPEADQDAVRHRVIAAMLASSDVMNREVPLRPATRYGARKTITLKHFATDRDRYRGGQSCELVTLEVADVLGVAEQTFGRREVDRQRFAARCDRAPLALLAGRNRGLNHRRRNVVGGCWFGGAPAERLKKRIVRQPLVRLALERGPRLSPCRIGLCGDLDNDTLLDEARVRTILGLIAALETGDHLLDLMR